MGEIGFAVRVLWHAVTQFHLVFTKLKFNESETAFQNVVSLNKKQDEGAAFFPLVTGPLVPPSPEHTGMRQRACGPIGHFRREGGIQPERPKGLLCAG